MPKFLSVIEDTLAKYDGLKNRTLHPDADNTLTF